MALRTLGTGATNSLTALQYLGNGSLNPADVGAFCALIQNDRNLGTIMPTAFEQSGKLFIPNRFNPAPLVLTSGDVVAIDPKTGWPILVSAAAINAVGSNWTLV